MPVQDEPEDFREIVKLLQKLNNKQQIINASKTRFRFKHGRGRGLSHGFSERGCGESSAYLA